MNMRKLLLRFKLWRLKRKFPVEIIQRQPPELLKSLVGLVTSKDLKSYRPTYGKSVVMEAHYLRVERLMAAAADATRRIRDQEDLTPERTLYNSQPSIINLDDYFVTDDNRPITPLEIIDDLDKIALGLITELVACKSIRANSFSYYQRRVSRIFADLVELYDALARLAQDLPD